MRPGETLLKRVRDFVVARDRLHLNGALAVLGNAEKAHRFLAESLKLLLLQLLVERQLIEDLKQC